MCLKNIESNLKTIAYKKSIPFCYTCYKKAPSGFCNLCFSDDLMRHLDGVGVEYGTDWVIEHIIGSELTPLNLDDEYEQLLDETYPEPFKIGYLEYKASECPRLMVEHS